jgi:hypothetical protein
MALANNRGAISIAQTYIHVQKECTEKLGFDMCECMAVGYDIDCT